MGSTMSFLTRRVANNPKAKKTPFNASVTGLTQSHATTSTARVSVTVKAADLPLEQPLYLTAALLTSITGDTPSDNLTEHKDTAFTQHFKLADPEFRTPGRVDLLLGQDSIPQILRQGLVKSEQSSLYCFNTMFGWVVGGHCSHPSQEARVHICCKATTDHDLDETLKSFWEVEETPSMFSKLSPEDQAALEHQGHGDQGIRCKIRNSPSKEGSDATSGNI